MKALRASLALIICLFLFDAAFGEEAPHPRVAELEQSLANQAHTFLVSRFPGMPFLVTVKLDPLFRNERNGSEAKGEQLPYFDLSSEEIVDEWDDPGKSLLQLQRRVRKAVISVAVPNQLPESEAVEIRESIISFLHLNAARDEVYINRKNWRTHSIEWTQVSLIGAGLLLFLMGLLWINRQSSSKIATALEESARKASSSAPAAPIQAKPTSEKKNNGGDLQMHDPVKIKDLAVRTIDSLCATPGFPSHGDVFELDDLGTRNAGALGALLVEFPTAVQEKLFAYSCRETWLQALNEPSVLDFESLMVLRKLLRNKHDADDVAWSALVLSVWRLSAQQRLTFLQKMSAEDAVMVLKSLPKGMALPAARKLFPGSWAQVINTSSRKVSMKASKCEELSRAAQEMLPLRTIAMLAEYRDEMEILEHLNVSDPYEEREIYQVLSNDSRIAQNRPPFFKLFDEDDTIRSEVCSAFGIDIWANALCDARTGDRQKIEMFFSDKQRFMFAEAQRRLVPDSPEGREAIGQARQQIAFYLKNLSRQKVVDVSSVNEPTLTDENSKKAA